VREWLARAVHAPRDPAWVADGAVADKWAPVSPVTGAFDVFQWRVPADALDAADSQVLAAKLDELVRLGAPSSEAEQVADDRSAAREDLVDIPGSDRDAAKPAARRAQGGSAVPSREATDVQTVAPTAVAGINGSASATGTGRGQLQPSGEPRSAEVVSDAGFAGRKDTAAVEASRPVANGAADAGEATPIAAGPKVVISSGAALPADNARTRTSMAEKKPLDPSMFIAPRAPDDPGVAVEDAEERKPRVVASGQR
jgi:HemY protein